MQLQVHNHKNKSSCAIVMYINNDVQTPTRREMKYRYTSFRRYSDIFSKLNTLYNLHTYP